MINVSRKRVRTQEREGMNGREGGMDRRERVCVCECVCVCVCVCCVCVCV